MKYTVYGALIAKIVLFSCVNVYAQTEYEYSLGFELDSRTGKYRPAYTYTTGKHDSRIWLDGSSKTSADTTANTRELQNFLSYQVPKGWKVNMYEDKIHLSHPDLTEFTLFSSIADAADAEETFKKEWNRLITPKYKIGFKEIERIDFRGKGDSYLSMNAVEENGKIKGIVLQTIHTEGRIYPIVMIYPDIKLYSEHKEEYRVFFESIDVRQGEIIEK